MIRQRIIVMGLLLGVRVLVAEPLTASATINTPSVTVNTLKTPAKQWGLSKKAYQQYQWLMHHTPSQQWYSRLDPAEVLALNTDQQSLMMHYAMIEAKLMHQRVSRELAFNKAYRLAYQRLYPHEKPIAINLQTIGQGNQLGLVAGDHLWLFTTLHNTTGSLVLASLLTIVEAHHDVVLDIYLVGDHLSHEAIEKWARRNNLPVQFIDHGITINVGNERFHAVSQGRSISLPYVGILHDRHFKPLSLSSI